MSSDPEQEPRLQWQERSDDSPARFPGFNVIPRVLTAIYLQVIPSMVLAMDFAQQQHILVNEDGSLGEGVSVFSIDIPLRELARGLRLRFKQLGTASYRRLASFPWQGPHAMEYTSDLGYVMRFFVFAVECGGAVIHSNLVFMARTIECVKKLHDGLMWSFPFSWSETLEEIALHAPQPLQPHTQLAQPEHVPASTRLTMRPEEFFTDQAVQRNEGLKPELEITPRNDAPNNLFLWIRNLPVSIKLVHYIATGLNLTYSAHMLLDEGIPLFLPLTPTDIESTLQLVFETTDGKKAISIFYFKQTELIDGNDGSPQLLVTTETATEMMETLKFDGLDVLKAVSSYFGTFNGWPTFIRVLVVTFQTEMLRRSLKPLGGDRLRLALSNQDQMGDTILHVAARARNTSAMNILLEAVGSRAKELIDIRNHAGASALEMCLEDRKLAELDNVVALRDVRPEIC